MKRRLIMLACLVLVAPAHSASFDCAKAGAKVEKLICADETLSKLDEELNAAYKAALQDEPEPDAVRQSQKQWMKYRNKCKDADCVKRAYEMQMSILTVTHIYVGETDVFTPVSIAMRRPGYPYKLNKGKGVEVCEIYRKNLELLENQNLACERKISPEYEGLIKLPDWRKLDLWENRNLWAQLEKMANGGVNSPERLQSKSDQWEIDRQAKSYQEHTEKYHEEVYKLYVANMDVDNDGKNELVLRYGSGLCGEPVHYTSIALFVLNEKGDVVELQKSRSLFQDSGHNRWAKELQQNGTFENSSMYDAFRYKDQTYFDRWTWTGVWIYKISKGKTEAVCQLN